MNFLQSLKQEMDDPRNRAGGGRVVVNGRNLHELIQHFERLDAMDRAMAPENRYREVYDRLALDIEAAYQHQGKSAETTLQVIMKTLQPLMEQRHKEIAIRRRFEG